MRKFEKLLLLIMIIVSISFITGCAKKDLENSETNQVESSNKSVASYLTNKFASLAKNEESLSDIAQEIAGDDILAIATVEVEVEENTFLDGFDAEISGFKSGYAIKPMVSSIPFIAYVFETSKPEELEKTLKENANKNWNICTEADDLETLTVDNYVFLVMSPTSFE
jgi:hypothetical protein